MFKPVKVPSVPLPLTDLENAKAEELLTAIVQVIKEGTQGASENTPPTLVEGKDGLVGLNLATEKDQHFYRQLAVAIAKVVPSWNKSPEEIDEELQKIVDELKKKVDKDNPVFDAAIIAKNIIIDGVDLAWDIRRRPDKYYVDQSIKVVQDRVDVVRKDLKDLEDGIAPIREDLSYLIEDVSSLKTWRVQVIAELENFGIELSKKADKEYVDSELSKKADKEYVDSELSKKADKHNPVLTGTPRFPTSGNVYFGDKTLSELLDGKADSDIEDQIIQIGNRIGAVEIQIPLKADISFVNTELGKKADTTFVNTELGKKADIFYVDVELTKKADTTYVNTELGKKADTTYVDTELGKKADSSDVALIDNRLGVVETNIPLKADKSYVDTELAGKVDVGEVYLKPEVDGMVGDLETEIAKKADTTYVDTELGKKADTTYVDSELSGKVDNRTFATALEKKADITYVDTELEKKADQQYVDDELGKKADKEYVDSELSKKADKHNAVLTGTPRLPGPGNVYFGDDTLTKLLEGKADSDIEDQITVIGNRLDLVEIQIPLKADTSFVNTELGKKADTTYVDTELGKKADIFYVDVELAKKADQDEVDAELAKKADIVYVDSELSGKVDNSTFTAELVKKADTTYVNTELGKKADTTYVDTELEKKADNSTVSSIDLRLGAVESDLPLKADTTYVDTALSGKLDTSVFNTEIVKKADTLYVDTELGKKADIFYVDVELAKKADQDEVDAELAKKADTTYVDSELSGKVDNRTFATALEKKADTTYVDTELGKKADQEYVDSELSKKADKEYVDSELSKKADKNNAVLTGTPQLPAPGSVRFGSNTLAELLDRKADSDDVGDQIIIINDRLHFLDLEILKKADQSYVDLELDKKAPIDSPSFTGDVTIGKRAYWEKEYQVSNSVHAELTAENDNPLDPTKVYRVQLVTRNTSTNTGANYIIYANEQGQWSVRYTSRSGSSGNHPRLLVNDNKVYVATFHTNLHTVRVIGETFDVGEIGASPSLFGPEVGFQIDGTTVRVADNRNLDVAGAFNASTLRQGGVALSSLFKDISYVPAWSEITSKPTTVSGFGITDAYTKTQVDTELGKKADTTYVNTELGKKADITYVDNGLSVKADIASVYTKTQADAAFKPIDYQPTWNEVTNKPTTFPTNWSSVSNKPTTISGYGITDAYTRTQVDSALQNKADTTYVDTALSGKLDTSVFNTEIAKKADTLYVDTELGKKADTTYVNTELGKKADIAYVDSGLESKADNSTVSSIDLRLGAVESDLPLKADTTYVDTALSGKLDTSVFNTEIAKKADATYVDTELAKKANTAYVNTELAKKADTTFVNTELGKKADTTYVNTALAKKADTTYVDTELGKKADTVYVNTELNKKVDHYIFVTELAKKANITYVDEGTQKIKDYIRSRGMNLVTNGTALLGDNTNWPGTEFDGTDTPGGGGGSFRVPWPGLTVYSEEFLPVDINKQYEVRAWAKGTPLFPGATWFLRILHFDIDRLQLSRFHVSVRPGTQTRLAQPLKPGDTVIHLQDVPSSWYNGSQTYNRTVAVYGYKNSFGYKYPDYTYTRYGTASNVYPEGGIDVANKTITLNAPWPASWGNPDDPNGEWPVGTAVANTIGGDSYVFSASYRLTDEWEERTMLMGPGTNNEFHPAVAFCKIVILTNRGAAQNNPDAAGSATSFANVWFGEKYPRPTDPEVNFEGSLKVGGRPVLDTGSNLDFSRITINKPTTISGYGIVDAYTKTQVDSALQNKADTSYVDTQLAGKVDVGEVYLKPEVDGMVGDLETEIAKKANTAYVNTELAKKADITYVDDRIEQIELTPGEDGREIELRVTGTHIQWRYVGDSAWTNLIALSELKGATGDPGKDAKEIELLVENGFIRWRREGEAWQNLIPLEELKGADGRDGEEIVLGTSPTHILWRYRSDENWIELISFEELKGEKGEDGEDAKEIELNVENGFIRWRRIGETWNDLIPLSELKGQDGRDGQDGQDGEDGKPVVLRKTPTHIEWQYFGEPSWTPLVPLEELKGEDGKTPELRKGIEAIEWRPSEHFNWLPLVPLEEIKGEKGDQGEDGRDVELRQSGGFIQWRHTGETTWTNLISTIDLTGPQGPPGEPGNTPFIGGNGNWWIGTTDTGMPAQGPQGPQGPKGDPGDNGLTPELRKGIEAIEWKYQGTTNWTPLVSLTDITGPQGPQGPQGPKGDKGDKGDPGEKWFSGGSAPSGTLGAIGDWYLNTSNGNVYEKTGTTTWTQRGNIRGPQGIQGPKGDPGENGRGVELRRIDDFVQWRHEGETAWTNLIPIIDLTGPQGPPGNTPFIGGNGHWWIGNIDTGVPAQGPQGPQGPIGEPGPNNAIRSRYSLNDEGIYRIVEGDEDFEQQAYFEGNGVKVVWNTYMNRPAVFVLPGRTLEGNSVIPVLEEVESTYCLITFETTGGEPDYPTQFTVIVVGER